MPFKQLLQFFKNNIRLCINGLLAILLVAQFGGLAYYAALNSDEQGIIAATDNDAEWVIAKLMRTRWYKDNGWAHYGPFFFRVAHTMQNFISNKANLNSAEQKEKVAHFALQLVSILSVFGICLLLSFLFLQNWTWRLVVTMALVSGLLQDAVWGSFLLRAHPDEMFAFVCAIAAVTSLLWLDDRKNDVKLGLMGLAWGIATATKLSTVMMAPGLLLFFFPPCDSSRLRTFAKFIAWAFIGYFVVGFPQTIVLDRPVRFLIEQNKFSRLVDGPALFHWLSLLIQQLWRPVLILFAGVLVNGKKWLNFSSDLLGRYFLFILVSLLFLIMHRFLIPADHYVFPWVVFLILGFGILMTSTPKIVGRFSNLDKTPLLLVLICAFCIVGMTPSSLNQELLRSTTCRHEIHAAQDIVVALAQAGEKVWLDPYFPYRSSLSERMPVAWEKSLENLDSEHFSALGLSRQFYSRFTGNNISDYAQTDNPHWQEAHNFYSVIDGQKEFVSPHGTKFIRIYSDECGLSVYRAERDTK